MVSMWIIYVALSPDFHSDCNSTAIAPQKHCMSIPYRNQAVFHSLIQNWDVALSIFIVSDGNSTAITPEKDCMKGA